MHQIFNNPAALLILVLIIVVVFGAGKLPGAAKSLGQSMRIFKDEVGSMKDDKATKTEKPHAGSDGSTPALEGDIMKPNQTERSTERRDG